MYHLVKKTQMWFYALKFYTTFYAPRFSTYSLLLSYERYLSIMKPLLYHHRMSKSVITTVTCTAWIFPALRMTVDTLLRTKLKIYRFSLEYLVYQWVQTITFLAIFILLASVNIAMFRVAKRQLQAIQAVIHVVYSERHRRRSSGYTSRREKRTTFFFIYIVTTFLVFWLPRIGCDIYELVHHKLLDHSDLDVMTLCIVLLNPIFDPLVYLFLLAVGYFVCIVIITAASINTNNDQQRPTGVHYWVEACGWSRHVESFSALPVSLTAKY